MTKKKEIKVSSGTVIELKNEQSKPFLLILDYGDYGTVEFITPVGSCVLVKIGIRSPDIFIADSD